MSQRPNRAQLAETLFCLGVVRPACRSFSRFFAAQVLYSSSRVGLRATGEISALRSIFMGDVVNKQVTDARDAHYMSSGRCSSSVCKLFLNLRNASVIRIVGPQSA